MNDTQLRPETLRTAGVVNRSTLLSVDDFRGMLGSVNAQLEEDFGPAWGLWWALAETTEEALGGYATQIVIVDSIDQPGALGYHAQEANDGLRAFVGVKPVLDSGGVPLLDPSNPQRPSVASVLSHEILELAVDPFCNAFRLGPERAEGALYSLEIADAVEALQYTKTLRDVKAAVSNFCLPAFYDPMASAGTQVDWLGLCPGPFQLTPGGYMSVLGPGYQLSQITADAPRPWKQSGQATSLRSRRRSAHVAKLRGA